MKRILLFAAAVLCVASSAWAGSFTVMGQLTVSRPAHDGNDGPLYESNVPLAVELTASNFNFTTCADPNYLRLLDPASQAAAPFFVDYWSASQKYARLWVNMPTARASTANPLWYFAGDSNVTHTNTLDSVFDRGHHWVDANTLWASTMDRDTNGAAILAPVVQTGVAFTLCDGNWISDPNLPAPPWGVDGRTNFTSFASVRRYNGVSRRDAAPGVLDTMPTSGSLFFWVRATVAPRAGDVYVSKYNGTVGGKQQRFIVQGGGCTITDPNGYGQQLALAWGVVNVGSWSHLGVTWSPNRLRYWANGVPVAESNAAFYPMAPAGADGNSFFMGGSADGNQAPCDIAGVVVLNRELSTRDVQGLFCQRVPFTVATAYSRLAGRQNISSAFGGTAAFEGRLQPHPADPNLVVCYYYNNAISNVCAAIARESNIADPGEWSNVNSGSALWTAPGGETFNAHARFVRYNSLTYAFFVTGANPHALVYRTSADGLTNWSAESNLAQAGRGSVSWCSDLGTVGVLAPDKSPDGNWLIWVEGKVGNVWQTRQYVGSSLVGAFSVAAPTVTLPFMWGASSGGTAGEIRHIDGWYYTFAHGMMAYVIPTWGRLYKSPDLVHWLPEPYGGMFGFTRFNSGSSSDFPASNNESQVADFDHYYTHAGVALVSWSCIQGVNTSQHVALGTFAGRLSDMFTPTAAVSTGYVRTMTVLPSWPRPGPINFP
jgi:hypothetical protein